jgi:hypothetical protein
MEQEPQKQFDGCIWNNRATEVIAEASEMPLGDRRRAALKEAVRLRIAAEISDGWQTNRKRLRAVRPRYSTWR